ncbi:acyl-CoA dehydrogenase/oxidase C-terminal [Stipitochalara longipes BDJ]|nr:acyl-CoA dehydrogenase/oxidase C-terminal [Stipitochalara longipes BDJ]
MERKPSTANDGFFQTVPTIRNQFYDDISFQRVMNLFLPNSVVESITPELAKFGDEILSKQTFDWVTDAERNLPYLRGGGRDAFGRRTSELVVSEGWRQLQNFGIENGIVAAAYEEKYSESTRVVQMLKNHLWTGSNANVMCPSAMTDGAAKLLKTHLSSNQLEPTTRRVFQDAYDRVTSRDPQKAWTSGQWMTERSGGSDVSGTETIAIYAPTSGDASVSEVPLGPWRIDGFKWFSSATDSSMTVLLAQTPRGLSTFFAPIYQAPSDTGTSNVEKVSNGVFIQRLKNKFGTKSLPTAELELSGTRGYLIGKEGQGIQEISTILNITRLYSAVSAVGYLGRGLAIAKSFARVREIGAGKGKRLMLNDSPLHMSIMAKIAGEYHSLNLFTFFGAWLLGISEQNPLPIPSEPSSSRAFLQPNDPADIQLLLRVLFPVLKASVCKRSIHTLQECMEALGGVGYLDNTENESINIARIYRDCCVLSIWEGTTDVLASDTLRVLSGRMGNDVLNAMDRWIFKARGKGIGSAKFAAAKAGIATKWGVLSGRIRKESHEGLLSSARDILFQVADLVMAVLLIVDAEHDKNSAATEEVCFRFLKGHGLVSRGAPENLERELGMNQKIVYGNGIGRISSGQSKL